MSIWIYKKTLWELKEERGSLNICEQNTLTVAIHSVRTVNYS